jgi:transcriptional regulator with XRE-family HTH domain
MADDLAIADYRQALGRRLLALRQESGKNQDDWSDVIGVHRSYVGPLETGKKDPRVSTLKKIALRLGLTLHELLPTEDDRVS